MRGKQEHVRDKQNHTRCLLQEHTDANVMVYVACAIGLFVVPEDGVVRVNVGRVRSTCMHTTRDETKHTNVHTCASMQLADVQRSCESRATD